jgi:hypothetical protein
METESKKRERRVVEVVGDSESNDEQLKGNTQNTSAPINTHDHVVSPSASHNSQLTPNSKHILNAQVAIRAPCCKKFFDVSGFLQARLAWGAHTTKPNVLPD